MEMFFLRLLSLIFSLLMFLFNTFSSIFPGLFPEKPIENTAIVCETEAFEVSENITENIVSDYISWIEAAEEDTEGFEEFNRKYFFTGSVALVKVELPNPDCTVEIESVSENGSTLELEYNIIYPEEVSTAVLETKIILVKVSKNITVIDASGELIMPEEPDTPDIPEIPEEPEEPEEPEILNGYKYITCDVSLFNDEWYNEYGYYNSYADEFYDYDSWKEYYVGSDARLNAYGVAYFEEKSLAVFFINVPYENKDVTICSIESDSNDFVDVPFMAADSEKEVPAGTTAVVVEIAKTERGGRAYSIGLMDEARVFSSDNLDNFMITDGYVEIVSTYSQWEKYDPDSYYTRIYNLYKSFFDENSLALITVPVPNRDYRIKLDPTKKDGNTVEVSYTLYTEEDIYYEDAELVHYYIIAAEISKNTTTVNVKENGFKNKWISLDYSFVTKPTLISDYEAWQNISDSSEDKCSKYDESYFEEYSLVLLSETVPDTSYDFEMIKVKENGDTLELEYGMRDIYDTGLGMISEKTLLVEVSKNIKNISASRKDIQNSYKECEGLFLLTSSGDETLLISDFETWKQYLDPESEMLEKYNENYFKNNSVALIKVTLPSLSAGSDIRYIYEKDDVLQVGYSIYDNGGFAVICYKTILVEVSKDITQIQVTELE